MIRRRGERKEGLCQHKEMAIEIGEAAAVEGIYGAMFHNLALSPPSLGWTATTDRGATAAIARRRKKFSHFILDLLIRDQAGRQEGCWVAIVTSACIGSVGLCPATFH